MALSRSPWYPGDKDSLTGSSRAQLQNLLNLYAKLLNISGERFGVFKSLQKVYVPKELMTVNELYIFSSHIVPEKLRLLIKMSTT